MPALARKLEPTTSLAPTARRACEITLERGRLLGALRSVLPFVCQDQTRFHLGSVSIELESAPSTRLVLVATDGHTLARVRIATKEIADAREMHQALWRADDVKAAIAVLKGKRGEMEQPVKLTVSSDGRDIELRMPFTGAAMNYKGIDMPFPPYEQVIPKHNGKPAPAIGLNPLYLARIGEAVDAFATCSFHTKGVKITSGGALDPVRFDFDHDGEDFTGVVMPMRME